MSRLILSIDSSLACPAFAVLCIGTNHSTITVIEKSHVKTSSKNSTGRRLFEIYNHVDALIKKYTFDEIVFEKGFNRFAVATQQIQRVVGVLTVCLYVHGYEKYAEISPTSVKKLVGGNGKASKDELAAALEKYVGKLDYKTDDESDAVAVGIAHAINKGWLS